MYNLDFAQQLTQAMPWRTNSQ